MTTQLPADWGSPTWGAKPSAAVGPPPPPGGATGPAPPSGPPPPDPPEPRRRRGRFLLSRLMFVFSIFVLLAVICLILVVIWFIRSAQGPVAATNDFMALIDERRMQDAYDSMCDEAQDANSYEDFVDHLSVGPITDYRFFFPAVETDNETVVSGTIRVNLDVQSVDFGLVSDEGRWQVCTYPVLDR